MSDAYARYALPQQLVNPPERPMPPKSRALSQDFEAHPDGRPHRKACAACAFLPSNPQGLTEDDFSALYVDRDLQGAEFYCAHRPDGLGRQRVCACWAAIERGRALAAARDDAAKAARPRT